MYFLFWYDYMLLPIYLILFTILFNYYFQKKHGRNPELKKHFTRGLVLKLVGCVAIAMIYELYYKGAYDGRFYFEGAKMLSNYLEHYPSEFFRIMFSDVKTFNDTNLSGLNTENIYIYANESFFVCKIGALFNFLSFNAFLPCSLFFCAFAFIGLWNFFIFLIKEFKLKPQIAGFCSLYIPSVLIWDSSIFKDTISFTALLWMFMCGYYTFIKPRKILINLAGFLVSAFVIYQSKVYILAAFAPFFILYVFNSYKSRIANPAAKIVSTPFVLAIIVVAILLFLQNAAELLGRYSVDRVFETANVTYRNITAYGGVAGSAYSLDVDFSSPLGLVKAIPMGIDLTLFRPYPWEYLKPFILLASAESMLILYFTLLLFFKGGFAKSLKLIWKLPLLQFCLLFSFLFAFMVGISAANFGTLVRYKIPCMPFYIIFLAVLYQAKFAPVQQQKKLSLNKEAQFS
jgi:hypothetical protein